MFFRDVRASVSTLEKENIRSEIRTRVLPPTSNRCYCTYRAYDRGTSLIDYPAYPAQGNPYWYITDDVYSYTYFRVDCFDTKVVVYDSCPLVVHEIVDLENIMRTICTDVSLSMYVCALQRACAGFNV